MNELTPDQAFAQILILLLSLDVDEGQVREIRRILAEVRQGGYAQGVRSSFELSGQAAAERTRVRA